MNNINTNRADFYYFMNEAFSECHHYINTNSENLTTEIHNLRNQSISNETQVKIAKAALPIIFFVVAPIKISLAITSIVLSANRIESSIRKQLLKKGYNVKKENVFFRNSHCQKLIHSAGVAMCLIAAAKAIHVFALFTTGCTVIYLSSKI